MNASPEHQHKLIIHPSITSRTMCTKCENAIIKNLKVGKKLFTTRNKPFTITSMNPDAITVRVTTGKSRPFHVKHTALVYHSMKFDKKTIRRVSSGRDSICSLIGEDGHLVSCGLCERSPAYIWGILSAMPDVRTDGTELSIE